MATENAYEALSYVWGDSNLVEPIYCCGKTLRVTLNCLKALKYLRRENESRTLWVDAICINQAGQTEEKNHQIDLMGDIYSGASKVLVWLGDKRGRLWLLMRMQERRSWWCGPLPHIADHGI